MLQSTRRVRFSRWFQRLETRHVLAEREDVLIRMASQLEQAATWAGTSYELTARR